MEIAIDAEVHCQGMTCGKVTGIIVEPINEIVTHFVVKESGFPYIERIISIKEILSANTETIILGCTPEEFEGFEPFVEYEFIKDDSQILNYASGGIWMLPLSMPDPMVFSLAHENVPDGEMTVHRGANVLAKDGHAGKIDEFIVERNSGRITHLVLHEGHLWGTKNVTIPISEVNKIDEEGVHLKLKKEEIEKLPSLKASSWFQ